MIGAGIPVTLNEPGSVLDCWIGVLLISVFLGICLVVYRNKRKEEKNAISQKQNKTGL